MKITKIILVNCGYHETFNSNQFLKNDTDFSVFKDFNRMIDRKLFIKTYKEIFNTFVDFVKHSSKILYTNKLASDKFDYNTMIRKLSREQETKLYKTK